MTSRTKIVFFVIMGLAAILVIGVFIIEQFAGFTLPTRSGEQVAIQLAAPPELFTWVSEAAAEFGRNNPQQTIQVIELEGLDANSRLASRNPEEIIDAWIAEADFVLGMAGDRLPFEQQATPVAQTQLVWLAKNTYPSLQDTLDWDTVHRAAINATDWRDMGGDNLFDLALSSPDSNIEGLATIISALASHRQTSDLQGASVIDREFWDWLNEILDAVPNRNRSPREQFSQTPSPIDAGILLEHELSQLDQAQFIQTHPGYNLILTYPYTIRNDNTLENSDSRRRVAEQFRAYLLSDTQQQKLADFGFAPVGDVTAGQSIQIDADTAEALWNQAKFQ